MTSLQEFKPRLVLFEIGCWQKPLENLLSELMNLKSGRTARKIILAESAELDDKVRALDLGADDFLLKPISSRELRVRIHAVLRSPTPARPEDEVQTLGELSLLPGGNGDFNWQREKKAEPKGIWPVLLSYGPSGPGLQQRRATRKRLDSWEIEDRRVVDVYIWRLREKIEADPSNPCWLITRRGKGYSLVAQASSLK